MLKMFSYLKIDRSISSIAIASCFLVGGINFDSALARTKIVQPAKEDTRISAIRSQIAEAALHRPRSFEIRVNVSQKRSVSDYVQSITERFILDIGGHSVEDYGQFKIQIHSIPLSYNRDLQRKTVMIDAKITDNSPTGNGQILLKSSLELECSTEEGYGPRDCPYDRHIIDELLHRLSL